MSVLGSVEPPRGPGIPATAVGSADAVTVGVGATSGAVVVPACLLGCWLGRLVGCAGRLGADAAGVPTDAGGSATTSLGPEPPPPRATAATAAAVATPTVTPAAVTAPELAATKSLARDSRPSTPAAPAPLEAR